MWGPELLVLQLNVFSFIIFEQVVACFAKFGQNLEDYVCQYTEKKGTKIRTKAPSIRSKEITFRLCKALKECMTVTPTLTCVEMQGLPLRERDLQALARVSYDVMTGRAGLGPGKIGEKFHSVK